MACCIRKPRRNDGTARVAPEGSERKPLGASGATDAHLHSDTVVLSAPRDEQRPPAPSANGRAESEASMGAGKPIGDGAVKHRSAVHTIASRGSHGRTPGPQLLERTPVKSPTSSSSSSSSSSSTSSSSSSAARRARTDEENLFLLSDDFIFRERLYTGKGVAVFRAYMRAAGARGVEVALKFIRVDRESSSSSTGEFLPTPPLSVQVHEAASGATNVVPFLGWHRLPDTQSFCEITQFVHSRAVDAKNELDVRRYMFGLLSALAALHERGIIYRDVKPENVLMSSSTNTTVLIDFDISTFLRPEGHRSVVGTEGYMAPEVLALKPLENLGTESRERTERERGLRPYGTPADLFSAGVLFGELLFAKNIARTGDIENARRIRKMLQETAAQPPVGGLTPLRALALELLAMLLRTVPSERISAAAALKHPYFAGERSDSAASLASPNTTASGSATAASITEGQRPAHERDAVIDGRAASAPLGASTTVVGEQLPAQTGAAATPAPVGLVRRN